MKANRESPPAVAVEAIEPARTRYSGGWRAGKPEEDPVKMKRWGLLSARPSEYLIRMRGGKLVTSGQGAACFKWPWDSVAIVPTTVQRLHFTADQVTSEKVGVQVTGLAVYRIAEPLISFRMLNFSFPERASEKLEQMLVEMFVGAARRLVANMTVEECLTRRKEGLASELMREIQPVVSGSGRLQDGTNKGWGVVLDTIEIQDVRVQSSSVFSNMQARFRQEQERLAKEAALATEQAVKEGEVSAHRSIEVARVEADAQVRQLKQSAEERARLDALAAEARVAQAQHEAKLAAHTREEALLRAQAALVDGRKAVAQAELAITDLENRRNRMGDELELWRLRSRREIENLVSPEMIQMAVAEKLPQLAAAFQQKMGEVHITSVDGANPFGYIAAAVEGVMGLARSAGIALPTAKE